MNIYDVHGGAVSGTPVGGSDGSRDAVSTDSDNCGDVASADDGLSTRFVHRNGIGLRE